MSYIANLLPFAPIFVLVAALIYLIVFMILKKKREKPVLLTILAEYALTGWFVVFIYITQIMVFGNGMGELFNVRPLHMFSIAFRYGSNNAGMVWQFLLNILMFVPLGFLLPIVFPKKCTSWPRILLFSFCTTLATELLQLITRRGTDIDDVIANTAGGLCGFALFTILYILAGFIKRHKTSISYINMPYINISYINMPYLGRKAVIGAAVLLAVISPFVAVKVSDGLSEYGNLYYGKWELNGREHEIIFISPYQTWSVHYPVRTDYTPAPGDVLNEDEALTRAWSYLNLFGITPDIVRYEAAQSRFDDDDCYLVFSNIESMEGQIIDGGVSVFLTVDGELMSIYDGRVWGEYVRDIDCISPYESIAIALDVGTGKSYGTAYISSVESDYEFIWETGYLIPVWKINARFKMQSGEYAWSPVIDAVK